TVWDAPETGGPLRALAAAASLDPAMRQLVGELVGEEIVARVARRLGPGSEHRAAAYCSIISGVIFSRYVLGIEPMASMPRDEVVRRLEPALRAALETG